MEKLSEDIWIHEDKLKLPGTNLRLRMTVVRLTSGRLWVHSHT
ncbi:MAG: methanol oxidase, partial [Proteobacteria bacterium]|nr:methanol oxidase [Pseudomonadota bacterium]